jgi:hypothetical protein
MIHSPGRTRRRLAISLAIIAGIVAVASGVGSRLDFVARVRRSLIRNIESFKLFFAERFVSELSAAAMSNVINSSRWLW